MVEEALLTGARDISFGSVDGFGFAVPLLMFVLVTWGILWSRLEPKRLVALAALGWLAYTAAPYVLG